MKFLTKPPYILSNDDDNNKRCKYHSAMQKTIILRHNIRIITLVNNFLLFECCLDFYK